MIERRLICINIHKSKPLDSLSAVQDEKIFYVCLEDLTQISILDSRPLIRGKLFTSLICLTFASLHFTMLKVYGALFCPSEKEKERKLKIQRFLSASYC
jgi:hypothetical protein